MKKGYLSQYFKGIAGKILSPVEADLLSSNQHEFNGVEGLRNILGEPDGRVRYEAKFLYLTDFDDKPITEDGFLTWYDARQRARIERGVMRCEYRLYFPTNLVSQHANAGDILVIAKRPDNTLLAIVAEAETTISQQLLWLFGFSDLSHPGFSVREELETEQDRIEFTSRFILENIGINIEVTEDTWLDDMLIKFGSSFPTTRDFSTYARSTLPDIHSQDGPDAVLMAWIEREEILFRTLEKHLIGERLSKGFDCDVEGFFSFSLSVEKLEELFPGILGGLDIDLIKKVKLHERVVPSNILWGKAVPRMMASNNWVISGGKTASGKPIVANDPHLEVNRLPNVWSEIVLKSQDRYFIGGSMPGFPAILTGRGKDVAWAVTYSFLDAIDSWIEQCQDGKYYREEKSQWLKFHERKEIIKRKKKQAVEVVFYENEHGVLDGNPYEEGYYLATRWAPGESGSAAVRAIMDMWHVKSVDEAMNTMGKVETGWNFIFADLKGDIGYQMTGCVPKRREGISGFVPLPGWKKENDWQGFLSHQELPHSKNPQEGYFATANNDLNSYGSANPINMAMGPYRADRIIHLLEQGDNFTVSDIFKMHFDLYSLQAEYFMKILKPLLPDTPQGKMLAEWDMKYDAESKGAYLFELFYKELYSEVFGKNGFGQAVTAYLKEETGVFIDFYYNFDRILLSESSAWFGGKSRNEIYTQVAARMLEAQPKKWQDVQGIMMTHLLFGNKLPRFLGFDRGPIVGIGSRATIHQGQIYRSGGRDTSFMPSLRTVTDMDKEEYFSVLAGGPSDRRFSKWYCSDLDNWISGKYKLITPDSKQKKHPFG